MSSLGQAAGGIVGGAIGFFTGGPAWALRGAQIGIMAGGLLDPPKGPTIRGPRLDDLSVQTATYGAFIPCAYGTVAVLGNVFWVQGDSLIEVPKTTTSGGKGGPTQTSETFAYYATFATGLCEGPIDAVRRIWIGGQLWYDAGSDDLATIMASNQNAENFTVYPGSDTQDPDPLIQADKGVANVSAHRGLAYLVFEMLPLEKYGNNLAAAQVKVEVVRNGLQAYTSVVKTIQNAAWPLNQWWATAASGSTIVVTSVSSSLCAYSLDGNNWTTTTMPSSGDWTCVAAGNCLFVAIQSNTGRTATSINGIKWDTGYTLPGLDYRKLIWNGSFFCAIAFASSRVFVSSDGVEWSEGAMPSTTHAHWIDVAWNGTTLCALQKNDDTVAVSTDGLTWTAATLPAVSYWTSIASDGAYFLAISGSSIQAKSLDGVSWSAATSLVYTNGPLVSVGIEWKTVYNGRAYVIATGSSKKYLISEDGGDTWTIFSGIQTMAGTPVIGSYSGITVSPVLGAGVEFIYKNTSITSESLGDIVEAECLKSSLLDAADLDVTELTDSVRGYRVSALGAIRAGLDPLRSAWPFDVVQHGYDIQFKKRGSASVATITAGELDARAAGDAPGVAVTDVREMDLVLPRKVSVQYLDVIREYDTNAQYAERLNTDAVNETVLDLPIVFNADEAAGKAEVLLYLYWLERYDVSMRLPPSYGHLEPGDVITVQATHATYELRLTAITYLADGRLECAAKYNSASLYTPAAQGEEGQGTGSTLGLSGPSPMALLDIPLLRDADDRPGYLVAMGGALTGWPGGILYRSDDDGATYADVIGFAPPGSTLGYATTALSAHAGTMYDLAGTLAVRLYQGSLASVSEAQLFAGQNWFAYGAHGRWEIIAARVATLQGDGSYVLRDFLRGQFGTEWATGLHAATDTIVLLDTSALAFVNTVSSNIGTVKRYRAITVGKALDSATDEAFTYTGVNLECLSPVQLTGNRHPSTNDWTLTWVRRSRFAGWRDYVDAALGETSEAYEVEIYSSGTYTTLKRTLTGLTSATATYTSAQQVTDFGSNQATLYLKIYQLSATVGRGYALTQAITR